jgi:hypothetical protein
MAAKLGKKKADLMAGGKAESWVDEMVASSVIWRVAWMEWLRAAMLVPLKVEWLVV